MEVHITLAVLLGIVVGGVCVVIIYEGGIKLFFRLHYRWFTRIGRLEAKSSKLTSKLDQIEYVKRQRERMAVIEAEIDRAQKRLVEEAFSSPKEFLDG